MATPGQVVLQHEGEWFTFRNPHTVLCTNELDEVLPLLAQVDQLTSEGAYAAGFVAYEASPAFDRSLRVHAPADNATPLLWFGIYEQAEPGKHAPDHATDTALPEWQPAVEESTILEHINAIKEYIAAGDTYQVNYTFPLKAKDIENPWPLFERMVSMQSGKHAAYVDTGDHLICSASPELFFQLDGDTLTCRPMKGTSKRGLGFDDDVARYYKLEHSPKDQSENIMIVDMIRNDLGKIAQPGSVKTTRIFDVEKYETVFQMISEVQATSKASLSEIFTALFPCASITGAPKVRTAEIIHELEPGPRGLYTGCIGSVFPNRKASFNVAIRTVQIDCASGNAEYHTGAGIVWDSDPQNEFRECMSKTAVLTNAWPAFELLETLLWEPELGFLVLPEHYRRLSRSARYFEYPLNLDEIDQDLKRLSLTLPPHSHRIRITVSKDGSHEIVATVVPDKTWHFKVALDTQAIDSGNVFLYHKTTHRQVYTEARERHPDFDDVILWNERGELTESTMANLVLRFGEEYYTPPESCGLLNGAFRQSLIDLETLKERVLMKDDLERADEILLINSVRKWITVSV